MGREIRTVSEYPSSAYAPGDLKIATLFGLVEDCVARLDGDAVLGCQVCDAFGLIEFSRKSGSPSSGVSLTSENLSSSSGSRRYHMGVRSENRDRVCIRCRVRFLGSCSGQIVLKKCCPVFRARRQATAPT